MGSPAWVCPEMIGWNRLNPPPLAAVPCGGTVRCRSHANSVIKPGDVDYTTAKSLAEQGAEDGLLEDFDKRLKSSQQEENSAE